MMKLSLLDNLNFEETLTHIDSLSLISTAVLLLTTALSYTIQHAISRTSLSIHAFLPPGSLLRPLLEKSQNNKNFE